jgi:hypothetical protein
VTERPPKTTIRGNSKGPATIVKGGNCPNFGVRRAETGPERAERLRRLVRGEKS